MSLGGPKCHDVSCLAHADRSFPPSFPEILASGGVRADSSVAACPSLKLFRAQSRNFPALNHANTKLSNTLKDRFQRAAERGIVQRVVATLVKPSCLIVDVVGRCESDRASVPMMRGPSYRDRGLATHSVEAVPQATNVRGCSLRGCSNSIS